MSQITDLIDRLARVETTLENLTATLSKIEKSIGERRNPYLIVKVISIGFIGVFTWLGVLTNLIMGGKQ